MSARGTLNSLYKCRAGVVPEDGVHRTVRDGRRTVVHDQSNVMYRYVAGQMDLWLAAQTGDLRRVCAVLGSKDDGRACASEHCSWPEVEELNRALFVAAANDHAPVVETLLQAKASAGWRGLLTRLRQTYPAA